MENRSPIFQPSFSDRLYEVLFVLEKINSLSHLLYWWR
jgi:hypothetical protein